MRGIKDTVNCKILKNDFSIDIFTHSVNVANIALRIASSIQLEHEERQQLYEAALYHDIGKSKIPEFILYKEDKLSTEEWEIMKLHAIYSEVLYFFIMNEDENYVDRAKVIRYHHENWDGTGYPDQISKDDIPLHSRIIRIADIFDAITRPRVYRPFKIKDPIKILKEMCEKEIDPYLFNEAKMCIHKLIDEIYL